MIWLDHDRARAVATLDRVGESVVDPRVDVELSYPSGRKLALDLRDERPNQPLSAMCRIDEHVEKAGSAVGPGGSADREGDERRAFPGRRYHRVGVRRLPAHLAL
jgi:hypothetical protein